MRGPRAGILAADEDHGARRRDKAWFVDAVACLLVVDGRADPVCDFRIGRLGAQESTQVAVVLAEKTGAEFAVSSQADARTMAAERLRYRGHQANLSGRAI